MRMLGSIRMMKFIRSEEKSFKHLAISVPVTCQSNAIPFEGCVRLWID